VRNGSPHAAVCVKDRHKKVVEMTEEKRTVNDLLLLPISFTKPEGSSIFELLRV
jgi:hypothetical protein